MANVINKIDLNNVSYNIASTAFAICNTNAAEAAKIAYIQGESSSTGFTLTPGVTIYVSFTNTNTAASPALSVNGSSARAIKICGTTAPGITPSTSWYANEIVALTYDGQYWQLNKNILDLDSILATLTALEEQARELGYDIGSGDSGGGTGGDEGGDIPTPPAIGGGWYVNNIDDLHDGAIIIITATVNELVYALGWDSSLQRPNAVSISSVSDDWPGNDFNYLGGLISETQELRFEAIWDEDSNGFCFRVYGTDYYLYINLSNNSIRFTTDYATASRWNLYNEGDSIRARAHPNL